MLRNLAEDITFLLIVHKIIKIEKRDSYINGIEVILFHCGLLIMFLLISLLSGTMINFWAYVGFSLPLQIFSGEYRTRTNKHYFFISTVIYGISVAVTKFSPFLYLDFYWQIAGIISVIVIFKMSAPKKHKKIIYFLLPADIVFFILCCIFKWKIATNELLFIVADALLLLVRKAVDWLDSNEK
ncbi:MAG: accessory gene regulator B family protein [Ruminococcus sp.]|nr:accessory gene regulator B family protein [Ruminococcus sp.]